VDDINEPTPCTLFYVKGRTLRTIEVADAIVMATRIMHGRLIPSECAVIEVTTIREGHKFDDLDYPDEEEMIEKLKNANGNFILWPP
jgi:alpha-glucosidase (family GH31 glycosyl hydrolase)